MDIEEDRGQRIHKAKKRGQRGGEDCSTVSVRMEGDGLKHYYLVLSLQGLRSKNMNIGFVLTRAGSAWGVPGMWCVLGKHSTAQIGVE